MRLLSAGCVLGFATLAVVTNAPAATMAFDSIGTATKLELSGGWFGYGDNQMAIGFVSQATGPVSEILIALAADEDASTAYTISLCADSGGAPGTAIWSQTYNVSDKPVSWFSISAYAGPTQLTLVAGPEIVAGTQYWVTGAVPAGVSGSLSWVTMQGATGPGYVAHKQPSSPWVVEGWANPVGGLAVSVVPEPSIIGLVAVPAILALRRRRD